MKDELVSKPDPTDPIADNGFATGRMRLFMDDIQQRFNDWLLGRNLRLKSYTVASLPPVPPVGEPGLIYVSNETGGAVIAFSDGTNWRRSTDRAIVS